MGIRQLNHNNNKQTEQDHTIILLEIKTIQVIQEEGEAINTTKILKVI